jgi:uncharacterized membrane protein
MKMEWPEAFLTLSALLTLLFYHVQLVRRVRHAPLKTSIGLANHLREVWVAMIIRGQRDVLAVQTLRNWGMASSFLASTAILIALGVLSASFASDRFDRIKVSLNYIGNPSETYWSLRLLILSLDFFFTFFNFCLAIRYYNHLGFVINIPPEDQPDQPESTPANILNRAGFHYTLGMRGYWLAVPLSFWLFGPIWLFLSTLLLIPFLYHLDHNI